MNKEQITESREQRAESRKRGERRVKLLFFANYYLLIAICCLITACSNPFDPPVDNHSVMTLAPGYGKVRVQFGNDARTVFPSIEFTRLDFLFAKDGGEFELMTPNENEPLTFTLETGDWQVKVDAYIYDDLAASGEKEFTISQNYNEPLIIHLEATTEENNGIFSYYIQSPLGTTVESITFRKMPLGTDELIHPTEGNNGSYSIVYGETELSAGFYLLSIRLAKDERYAGKSSAVHIYGFMTTEYGTPDDPIIFEEDDFSLLIPVDANDFTLDNYSHTSHTYDSKSKAVTVVYRNTYMNTSTAGDITIYYSGTGNTDYPESQEPPFSAGTYDIKVTTTGGSIYAALTEPLYIDTLTIAPRPLTITGVIAEDRAYEPSNFTVTLTGGMFDGAITEDALDFELIGTIESADAGNNKPVTTNITITGSNRDSYDFTPPVITVNINKAEGATVAAPTLDTRTLNSITVNAVETTTTLQDVEYTRSNTTTAPSTGWQNSTIFTGLSEGTTYYIFARSAETSNYKAGEPSHSDPITTLAQKSFTITYEHFEDVDKLLPWQLEGGDDVGELEITHTTGDSITLELGDEYTSADWYIDRNRNDKENIHRTGLTFTLNPVDFDRFDVGTHTLTVEVVRNGNSYSRTIRFDVSN